MLRCNHQKKLLKKVADAYHTILLDMMDVILLQQQVYNYNAFFNIMHISLVGRKGKIKQVHC